MATADTIDEGYKPTESEAFMNERQRDYFRRKLLKWKEEILRESRETLAALQTENENHPDIADRASSSYTKEFLFHQSNNERQLLQMVQGALERIRQGTFGECIACGCDINAKRLEAVPWTRHCIACQEKLEQGQLEQVGS